MLLCCCRGCCWWCWCWWRWCWCLERRQAKRIKNLEGGWGGGRSASPPECIADDHDGGLCSEPVVDVVVVVAGAGGAGGGGVGAVRGGKLKE